MDIKSMTLDELNDACQQMGEKPCRAKQLYDWMHHRLAGSYDEMTNLSLAFREKLKEQYPLTCLEKVQVQESKIDGTRKYLFRLSDGNVIESVWMKYHHGNSVCISSQVGCRMGWRPASRKVAGPLLPWPVPDSVGDARPDLPDLGGHRGAGLQSGCHGNG